MRLEVLVPQQWSHPSKEFLMPWCTRVGYRPVWTGQFEECYIPSSRRLLRHPATLSSVTKSLPTLPSREDRDKVIVSRGPSTLTSNRGRISAHLALAGFREAERGSEPRPEFALTDSTLP
jgi:hypothetical protein